MGDAHDVSPRTRRLQQTDQRVLWHPFTPMRLWMAEPPLVIEAGEGFELIDTEGRRYIDGVSSLWCNVHGHRVPAIDAAVREQLDRIAHTTLLGLASPPSIELAEALLRAASPGGGLTRVFYSDSGSTAVEIAAKIAYQYWQNRGQTRRGKFVAFRNGYHGDTIGSVSLGGIDLFHSVYRRLLFDTLFADSPCPHVHPAGADAGAAVLGQVERLLGQNDAEVCAVVVEPLVQGAGGILTHPPGFLRALRELTRDHDVLLIADEVATGFGRTGRMFACHHEDVQPDLACLAKGISGGYLPLAATLTTEAVFDAFVAPPAEGRTFFHGHTYTGNPLACAAGLASLRLFGENRVLEQAPAKIERIAAGLRRMERLPNVARTRQCGFMVGIDLAGADRRPFEPARRTGAAVCQAARAHGVLIRPLGDTVVLMPAPAMDAATLDRLLAGVEDAIAAFFRT